MQSFAIFCEQFNKNLLWTADESYNLFRHTLKYQIEIPPFQCTDGLLPSEVSKTLGFEKQTETWVVSVSVLRPSRFETTTQKNHYQSHSLCLSQNLNKGLDHFICIHPLTL